MAHPIAYQEDDPILDRVRALALALPGAREKLSHGCPTWHTTKVFASWRAHLKGDHASPLLARALCVLPDPEERRALLEDERFHEPGYIAHRGWVALDLAHHLPMTSRTRCRPDDAAGVDFAEVAELLDMSFRNTAGVRLVRELDARASAGTSDAPERRAHR